MRGSILRYDAHYHTIWVDTGGRIHLAWNPHYYDGYSNCANGTQYRYNIVYAYSDDNGAAWKQADGDTIASLPIDVDNFSETLSSDGDRYGGTVISAEHFDPKEGIGGVYLSSMVANEQYVHVLYKVTPSQGMNPPERGTWHVIFDRSTGEEIARKQFNFNNSWGSWAAHANLVLDPNDEHVVWIVGPYRFEQGDSQAFRPSAFLCTIVDEQTIYWACWDQYDRPLGYGGGAYDYYQYSTAPSVLLSSGTLAMITSIHEYSTGEWYVMGYLFDVDAGEVHIADGDFSNGVGDYATFVVTCGTPGATVTVTTSLCTGSTAIPGCSGVYLELQGCMTAYPAAYTGVVGDNGIATVNVYVPSSYSGQTAYFQAYEAATCRISQLVSHGF